MLRRSNWVSKVQAVPEAFVPVLKLEIRGIDIDLPYAQLPIAVLPRQIDLQANHLLRGMDPKSVTSFNGCRVTDKLVQLNTVNGEYRKAFQDALRFLKVWALASSLLSVSCELLCTRLLVTGWLADCAVVIWCADVG